MDQFVADVMDCRLQDLLACWRQAMARGGELARPVEALAAHADNLLVIGFDGPRARYGHYGAAFIRHFGTDLSGEVIEMLPAEILPADRRGMLEFEYGFVRRTVRPLWRSYTAEFEPGVIETWQRLVLPIGNERLIVGAYPVTGTPADGQGAALLRLLIERVPAVLDEDGRVADLALTLRDFSDTRRHAAALEVLAAMDPLTGVANLRHFNRLADMEMEHARRMGRAFSVLALDIDHFKRINDSHGHATGDDALRAFVAACRVALREPDILGRVGGEEFAVALPNTGAAGAAVIAERLRRQVESISLPLAGGDTVSFTVSIGAATIGAANHLQAQYSTVAEMLQLADKALYTSKQNGRNQVTLAGEITQ